MVRENTLGVVLAKSYSPQFSPVGVFANSIYLGSSIAYPTMKPPIAVSHYCKHANKTTSYSITTTIRRGVALLSSVRVSYRSNNALTYYSDCAGASIGV